MSEQTVIFVDAGFLLAAGGQRVLGSSLRSAATVDFQRLVEGIQAAVAEHSGLPMLRTYWYDASKDALFTEDHKRLGLLPGVKVRLGRISFSGEQKGVDMKLALDLVGIARNRAATTAYVLSGDDDLAEALEEAQDLGLKAVLVGISTDANRFGLLSAAEHLALQADEILVLPDELLEATFSGRKVAPSERTGAEGASLEGSGTEAAAAAPAVGSPSGGPKPGPGASSGTHPGGAPVTTGSMPPVPRPTSLRPYLASEPGASLVYSSEHSQESLYLVAQEVGSRVAAAVYSSITQAELEQLMGERPQIQPDIDRSLLKDCAARMGELSTSRLSVKQALRTAFWDKLDELS
ncbi:NYN domain-containing protein [Psychromicrobium xiongbiense]|uniref:NYN domain-containing protein n=1 Tax=Psychromicrobium xiongbiense TaxID=3051184 RepID=UPI002556E8F5|nr:NYN domain-containing protein [Psychromicrobium sp. YIM S02556]